MIELFVVPAAFDAVSAGHLSELALDADLQRTVRTHLDRYRLLTTTLNIREPDYVGIKVGAKIVLSEVHRSETVIARVADYLKHYVTPLALATQDEHLVGFLGSDWEGWPFGRNLYVSEIYSLIQQVPGVKHVVEVELGQRRVVPSKESAPRDAAAEAEEGAPAPGEAELTPVEGRMVPVPVDTLLCSLDHEIQVVEL
jgi:hypothetical protein